MAFFNTHAIAFLLLVFVALGIIGQNPSVTISAIVLLLVQQTPLVRYAPLLEQYGLKLGIVVLTIGVLAPLVSGKIRPDDILMLLTGWKTAAAILVGIAVAWLGGRGVKLMLADPPVVTGLLVGTVIGVAFFRGVPVGPLIAAGLLSLILWR